MSKVILTAFIVAILMTNNSLAVPQEFSEIGSQDQNEVFDDQSHLRELLLELQRNTDELAKQIKSDSQPIRPVTAPNDDSSPLPKVENNSDQLLNQKAGQIRNQLELLKRLSLRNRQESATKSEYNFSQPDVNDDKTAENNAAPIPEQNLEPMVTSNAATMLPSAENKPPILNASRIVPKPVDPISLGTSLFLTHNYDAAIQTLESIDKTNVKGIDANWIDYMTATCQKRIGDYKTSESILRQIANDSKSYRTVEAARWWLSQIESVDNNQQLYKRLESEIDAINAKVESLTQTGSELRK